MKLSYVFLFTAVLLPFQVNAMETEDDNNQESIKVKQLSAEQVKDMDGEKKPTPAPQTNEAEKQCCYHWGLSRWIVGIKEYIQRAFLCGYGYDFAYTERMYTHIFNERITYNTDCYCNTSDCMADPSKGYNGCGYLVFCPCFALTHLCTLPVVVCRPEKHQIIVWNRTYHGSYEEYERQENKRRRTAKARRNATRGSGPHVGFGYYGGGDDGGSYSSGGGS